MAEDQNKAAARAEKAAGENKKRSARAGGNNRGNKGRGRGPNRGRQVTSSPPEFDTKTVALDRVSRMQAGGRRFRFRAVVAVGNRKGVIGIGVGKAPGVRDAIEKATRRAHMNKITVPRVNGSIPREIEIKLGTSRILLRPARPGHGVVAGGVVRTMCDLAGITDISAKILSRSSNNLANARATMAGFEKLSKRVAISNKRKAGLAGGKKTEKKETAEKAEAAVGN